MKRLVSLLILICLTSFVYAGGPGQGTAVHTLVIDPGHGGMDPGAIGPGGHHESDLALAVSLKFGEMVKEAFPDVKIIYTRTTDKFVSLADRADMANKAKADLFICIHLNSATNHDAYGTATYVLGLHRTDDNLEIAKRENAVIDLESNKDKKYEFDPNSPEGHIIMSMKQNAFLDQSILIASKIEDELAVLSKRKSRGVKQAGFWVLYKTAMPSLLAEIGFISNPTEEQYLATDNGQTNIATSIFKAFRSYKNEIEGRKDTPETATTIEKKKEVSVIPPQQNQQASQPDPGKQPQSQEASKQADLKQPQQSTTNQSPPTPKKEDAWQPDTTAFSAPSHDKGSPTDSDTQQIKMRTAPPVTKKLVPLRTGNEPSTITKKEEPKAPVKTAVSDTIPKKPAMTALQKARADSVKAAEAKALRVAALKLRTDSLKAVAAKAAEMKAQRAAAQKAKADSIKAAAALTASVKKETTAVKSAPKETTQSITTTPGGSANVVFTVQILAAHKPPKDYDELVNVFGLINREDIADGVVRYMAGQYHHYKDAQKMLELAKQKGFTGAFIICYLDDVRQDVKKSRELGLKYP